MGFKKAVKGILKAGVFLGGIAGVGYLGSKSTHKEKELKDRYASYYQMTNQWLNNKNNGKELASYFKSREIKSIAIYGMGTIGELLYQEIKDSEVSVPFFIDKNANEIYYSIDNIPVMGVGEAALIEEIQAVIVTPVFDFKKIEEELSNAGFQCDIISLEDIVFDL